MLRKCGSLEDHDSRNPGLGGLRFYHAQRGDDASVRSSSSSSSSSSNTSFDSASDDDDDDSSGGDDDRSSVYEDEYENRFDERIWEAADLVEDENEPEEHRVHDGTMRLCIPHLRLDWLMSPQMVLRL